MENNNYISLKKRILTSIMSMFIGMFIGIIISQIIGNSLIIISLNKFFSIVIILFYFIFRYILYIFFKKIDFWNLFYFIRNYFILENIYKYC